MAIAKAVVCGHHNIVVELHTQQTKRQNLFMSPGESTVTQAARNVMPLFSIRFATTVVPQLQRYK
jgi:hypothetical protein